MGLELVVDTDTGEIARPEFDDFWLLYPKRVARKDALKMWVRLSEGQKISALIALVEWRKVWAAKDVQYVPNAATWINGERWDDELPNEFVAMAAAHKPAVLPEEVKRGAIPDHVRALLAKLRGR